MKKISNFLVDIGKYSWGQLQKPFYQGFAEQIAFYLIMSLVPILLLIVQLSIIIFSQNWQSIIDMIDKYLEHTPFKENLQGLIHGTNIGSMSIVFLIIALYSASKCQYVMIKLANYTMSDGDPKADSFLKDKLKAMGSIFGLLLIIIAGIVILIYGDVWILFLFEKLGWNISIGKAWIMIRWPLSMLIYFMAISYLYYILPSIKVRYKDIVAGSLFASIGILLVTYLYSKYIKLFANYNLLYGSMANIISLLLWFYFLAWVICFGMLINKYRMDKNKGK